MTKSDNFRSDWIKVLTLLELAREDLWAALNTTDKDRRRDAAREYWKVLSLVFDRYQHDENWRRGRPEDEASVTALPAFALPPIVARNMSRLFWTLSTGEIPEPILDVTGPGRAETGPYETMGQMSAAIYVQAAKRGVINDPSPVKTAAEAYGVSRETVRKWCNAYPDVDQRADQNPELVEKEMRKAGQLYQRVGRGGDAIKNRDRKRK
jgi:hypothetical protein